MIIYQATNNITGDFYIGMTTQLLVKRKSAHERARGRRYCYFQSALQKYGKENFTWETIDDGATDYQDLRQREMYYISLGKPKYNLTKGGDGPREFTEESRKRMSNARKGIPSWHKGKKVSEQTRIKMGVANKKRMAIFSERKKISDAMIAKKPLDQKGVFWDKYYMKWKAAIRRYGKLYNLGHFAEKDVAYKKVKDFLDNWDFFYPDK